MSGERAPGLESGPGLTLGGMARPAGIDFFGPNYRSAARKRDRNICVWVERSGGWRPGSGALRRISRWPVIRSLLFWANFLLQVLGSLKTLLSFLALLAGMFALLRILEFGAAAGGALPGGALELLATFPILPLLLVLFAVMRLTALGRYHGAEHKAVAAYERTGTVTLEEARRSSRIHPRCGTNILIYILAASLIEPFVSWWPYAILQFLLISEAWFVFGQTRPSIAVGNFFQRYFTTAEPRLGELEVAVESLRLLISAERYGRESDSPILLEARY
ncbi:DUF1385 domain-containing protein [Rubrobacter taiwanensis]|uniref:DUF1385 domain-containing protein n=1 Tax=Rubrobacter taiwanensis TaxID=185139 RepID=A0A4R1BFA6_9ACTN|nr:DUF1385 domain-containing protein [Rubrobacter taiwanensis]TCJ15865.1 DUF1385 domain-containing protein [Rubrobacter taiwanensis]